jgi:hypothetical protein
VGVNNNFNCTTAEFEQLDAFAAAYPDTLFFVNSSIKTPLLHKIKEHPYLGVVTLNPDILIDKNLIRKFSNFNPRWFPFIRIKYVPNHPEIITLIKKFSQSFKVVITLQRFNGKKSIVQFVPDYQEHYHWSHNRFRLFGDSLAEIEALADGKQIFICDQLGLGCGGCGLCSTLVAGKSLPIYTLNLSSSGMCPFNCVDCYAKTLQHFLSKIGMPEIHYDWIHMNHKQSGHTKHIKDCKKKK